MCGSGGGRGAQLSAVGPARHSDSNGSRSVRGGHGERSGLPAGVCQPRGVRSWTFSCSPAVARAGGSLTRPRGLRAGPSPPASVQGHHRRRPAPGAPFPAAPSPGDPVPGRPPRAPGPAPAWTGRRPPRGPPPAPGPRRRAGRGGAPEEGRRRRGANDGATRRGPRPRLSDGVDNPAGPVRCGGSGHGEGLAWPAYLGGLPRPWPPLKSGSGALGARREGASLGVGEGGPEWEAARALSASGETVEPQQAARSPWRARARGAPRPPCAWLRGGGTRDARAGPFGTGRARNHPPGLKAGLGGGSVRSATGPLAPSPQGPDLKPQGQPPRTPAATGERSRRRNKRVGAQGPPLPASERPSLGRSPLPDSTQNPYTPYVPAPDGP